jgi:RND family efflux transporter MFP subunit
MDDSNKMTQQETLSPSMEEKTARPSGKASLKGVAMVALLAAVILGFLIYSGIRSRAKADTDLARTTGTLAKLSVQVAHPKVVSGAQEVVLPGNMQAFVDTPIWARTNGYLKAWYVDIGGHVKAGQLLAEIESPEVDQQLQQGREDLNTAQANLKLAQLTAERYSNLFKSDSVAKQDVDNAVQNAAARTAGVASAQANVGRLQQLVGYEKVYAPFDGIVTARNVDVGALVDAGAGTSSKELFHLAATSTLRVYVSVPETEAAASRPGAGAYLTVAEHPGQKFSGIVVRNANAIDPASRTLLVEVDVKNGSGELLPGSYASVHLSVPGSARAVVIPVNTLLFRSEGLRVVVVRDGKTVLLPVTLGRDFGESVEVLSGLNQGDLVVVNPSDSILAGQDVEIAKQS